MCDFCEDDDDGERPAGIDLGLIPAARAIEAGTPGDRVDETAWSIFMGRASGGISWADYQRILSSYEAAEAAAKASLAKTSLGRRRRATGSFRCEEAVDRV